MQTFILFIRFLSFHDHPHMSVVSKVLFGELERVSIELIEDVEKKKNEKKKNHNSKKSSTSLNEIKKRFIFVYIFLIFL